MEKIAICVYRDTIKENKDDWNLTEIWVTEEFAKQYFVERILEEDEDLTFEDFLDIYTADWTEDFYSYAMEHDAIIEISKENF